MDFPACLLRCVTNVAKIVERSRFTRHKDVCMHVFCICVHYGGIKQLLRAEFSLLLFILNMSRQSNSKWSKVSCCVSSTSERQQRNCCHVCHLRWLSLIISDIK